MKSSKEMAEDVILRIRRYNAEKRRRRIKLTKAAAALSSACIALTACLLIRKSGADVPPRDMLTSNVNSPQYTDETAAEEPTDNAVETANFSAPTAEMTENEAETAPADEEPTAPESPATDPEREPTAPEDEPAPTTSAKPTQPADAPSPPDDPGTPGIVYSEVSADHDTAAEKFGHPIVPCYDGDFLGYRLGIISANGDPYSAGSVCISVTYSFSGGTVNVTDNSKGIGEISVTLGEKYAYDGRDFYVWYDDLYGLVQVGFAPSYDSSLVYQAVFGNDTDIYEVMERIISIEIN